ncbi:phage tail protein [Lactobacillus crispatus]|jgi:tape measure protein|uniref:tape measure protein n=1 Tax=Lactobacillus crispatus TaxID=47770 RepID=UPI00105E091B|nr:tape measure protein [Lactobacillus crispatus]MCT7741464.1 tape measure protein [Lactobacillus crispatus]MCT7852602.1 tape measure protein [Lactobacillus crispatus]MCZ3784501.1 tape measure protein [Lactobacillus crispatus]MCZ3792125.1 tape measure protein [Lactobacillus crispatus]MCZ9601110.1 tape measure protein [Lactobacillus crispatus]
MAGSIPVGSLVTDVKLNGSQPVTTLKELKQAVSGATSAWRAQEAVLKSAGKQTEAAKAKYAGLTETVKNQRKYIEALADKQRNLKKVQAEADQTTEKGKQAYKNATEEIQKNAAQTLRATTRLESLTKQQEKAKSSLNYYKSGLAEAQKSLKQTQAVTKSYVERLKAEGKGYESAKAKLNGYKSSLENLNKQQKIQAQELARIASESGKSSDAYKRQEIRLNQTATTLAKTKSAMNELNSSMHKANPTVFDKLKTKLTGLDSQAEKTHRTFKEVFMGSALGNALSNSLSNIGSSLKNAYEEGMNLNLAVAKINGRFKGMGMSTRQIQSLDKQLGELKANTAMTGDNVANLQAHMLNWSTIGTKGAMQMAKTIAGVGDTSKLTGDQIERVSASLQRVGSTGKVTYSSLSRITKAAPTFMQALAKGAGMSQSKMIALLKTGKVTQKQFQQWMASASKYSDDAFKGFGKTQAGALKSMQVARQKLEQQFTKPIFNAKTSGLQALKNIMTSKAVMNGAQQLGKAISNMIGFLDKHKSDLVGITKDVVSIGVAIGKDVWKYFAGIIQNIGKALGIVHGNGKKSGDALHTLKLATDGLARNKTAIQWISKAIIAMAAAKGISKLGGGFLGIARGSYNAYKNVKALRAGFTGLKDFHDLTGAERSFAHFGDLTKRVLDHLQDGFKVLKNSKLTSWASQAGKNIVSGLKKGATGIGKASKWIGSKLLEGSKAIIDKATTLGTKIGQAISKAVQASTKFSMGKRLATGALAGAAVATPEVINAVKDRHSADKRSQDIGGAVGAVAGGALTSMIPVVGPMLAPVGAIIGKYAGQWGGQAVNNFTKGWQKNKPPKKFWSLENLGWSTHDTFNKIGKWGSDVGKKFGQSLNKGKSFVKKNSKELALTAVNPIVGIPTILYKNNPKFRKWANGVAKNIKGGLNKAKKSITGFKNSVNKNFKKAWDSAYKHASKGTKQIMRSTEKFAKNYVKINKKANSETIKNFGSFSKRLKKNHGNLFKAIGQTAKTQLAIEKKRWSSNWKNIKTTAAGIWKGLRTNASDMYAKLNKSTHGGLGKVFDGFKDFGKNIGKFWSDLWKGITKTFDDTVKGLQDAAGNVQKFFTGKLKVGNLHLAGGTDWRSRYGVPAIVNDAPGNNYREGLITNGEVVPFPAKRNLPIWLMPGQDIINGDDMAKHFGSALHYASGTVHLSKDHRYSKKNYELAKKRAVEDKKELEKLGDKISNALKHKDGNEAKRLTAEFNKLTKKYSADKKAAKKPDPHAGKVLVDQGLLIGAKSRIGHSVYISKDLFKKLIANLKKKKSTTRRRTTTHKRSSTTARRTSTRRYSSRVTTPRISSGVSARISTVGLGSINGLSKALKGIKSKSIKVVAKASGTKAVVSLAKSVDKVKGSSHKVIVKTSGLTSLRKLAKAANKIKGKTHKVRVRTSGTKGLKSLQKNITFVHKRIDSLSKASKKDKFGKAIAKQAEEAVKSLKGKGNFAKQFNSMVKKFEKDLKAMVKTAQKEFKSMWSNMEHSSKTSQSSMLHSLSSFSKKFKHDWSSLQSGVYKSFSHFWTNMRSAAGRGVNNVIRILNSAIGKIDSVISDFGGSKRAVKSVTPVRYAEGTDANGRLTQDTLAIVNDAKSGPRQEAIVTDQNDVILPKGNYVPVMLRKGWGVLNGAQTQRLGLPHYADGTGLSLKKLYDIAKHNWNNPTKTGNSMFSTVSGLTGAMKELASGMRSKSKDQGVTWWSQLWKMVEDKVNDDDLGPASGLLKAVETLGKNKHYSQSKRMSKFFADCSSLVSRALYNNYGAKWAEPNGWALTVAGLWDHAHRISKSEAKPGDPVFWLPDTHVGIYAGRGMYYSAYGPNDGGPIGMQPVGSGATFGRFKGINTEGSEDTKEAVKVKANDRLQKQIKNQVGQGFWHTIQKIADKYGEQFNGANSISGSMIEAAARKMHVHLPDGFVKDVLRVAMSESGNRNIKQQIHDVNSGGNEAQGPLQFTPQTFKAFAVAGHTNIHNPYDELLAFFNNSDWRNSIGWTTIWGHRKFDWLHSGPQGHRRFANGGIANSPSVFGEAGPEMAIPLIPSKSTRAWELIGKAIAILSANTTFGQQQNQIDSKEQKEEHEFRQSVLLLLRQLVNKSSVANIKLTTPAGRTLWEVVEPFSKAEQRAAMIKLRRGLSGR